MSNILLVGAGQLGSRYLQGLLKVTFPLNIFVVDPSEASLAVARSRADDLSDLQQKHNTNYSANYDSVPSSVDLAIVSTPSNCRAAIVRTLAATHKIKYWILEKLLAQTIEDLDLIENILSEERAWVNTPRRLMELHKNIGNEISKTSACPRSFFVDGGNWGLACNSIHFIDLVSWWCNSKVLNIESTSNLAWFESQRKNFFDSFGELYVTYEGGHTLRLSSNDDSEPISLILESKTLKFSLNESKGSCNFDNLFSINGSLPYQSELSTQLVIILLEKGICNLPTIKESLAQHRHLLRFFIDQWSMYNKQKLLFAPIT